MSLISWTAGLLLGLGIAAIIFRSDNKIEEIIKENIEDLNLEHKGIKEEDLDVVVEIVKFFTAKSDGTGLSLDEHVDISRKIYKIRDDKMRFGFLAIRDTLMIYTHFKLKSWQKEEARHKIEKLINSVINNTQAARSN